MRTKGFTLLYIILILLALALASGGIIGAITLASQRVSRSFVMSAQAFYAAESGLEDAAYRIKNLLPYSPSYTIPVGSSTATVTVNPQGVARIVNSKGERQTNARSVEAVLSVSTSSVSFFYGVQAGTSGLTMGNSSTVAGNVFSNGDIHGDGADKSTIAGTAQAAGSSDIKDIKINGNAHGDELEDCIVGGTAFYFDEIEDCATGSRQALAQQIQPQGFPISQSQIDEWKTDAAAGGTQGGASYGNSAQATLGPKKIDGSLSAGNNAVITLRGTVWITGAMTLGNTAVIQLDPGYGQTSGVLIVDGAVSFGDGAILRGSGQAQSKLLIISLSGGTAFSLGNSGTGDIFYASNGTISAGNGFIAKEVTGKGLSVGNSATVTYESGLADTQFSAGPGATFRVQTWKEIE